MEKRIQVALPQNINSLETRHLSFFMDHYMYEEQPVVKLNNGFVTFNGIVLGNGFYVSQSCYGPVTYKQKYWGWALKFFLFSFITRWGRSHKFVVKSDKWHAIIHQPYINYFHFTIESLTRLQILKNEGIEFNLLVPQELLDKTYIKQWIELLQLDNLVVVPTGNTISVKKLLVPTLVRWVGNHNPSVVNALRSNIIQKYMDSKHKVQQPYHSHVFISRQGNRRKISNFHEIEPLLHRFGYQIIDYDKMSVYEQIESVRNAKVIIGQHGAGLTNILLAPKNATLLEIHIDPAQNQDFLDDNYYKLASMLGINYYAMFADIVNAPEDPHAADCSVDAAQFQQNLELLAQLK